MAELKQFSLPLRGLKDGVHQFDFQVDAEFFTHFKSSPIQEGEFEVIMYFDKRPDMIVLTFDIAGHMQTECDRCLEQIRLPIKGEEQLLIKYAEEASEDAEVIYIPRGTSELNVARFVYEYICLSVPMVKTYDCESEAERPCSEAMLKYLDSEKAQSGEEETPDNPIWEALKNIKKN